MIACEEMSLLNNRKLIRTTYYIMLIATLILFLGGLRSEEHALLLTLLTLPGWGICYLLKRQLSKLDAQDNSTDEGPSA